MSAREVSSHDSFDLWGYARGELSAQARSEVEAHLQACPGCRESLEAARQAQALLSQAAGAPAPRLDWRRVDDAVLGEAARRMVRRGGPGWAWAGGGLLAACAVALLLVLRPVGSVTPDAATVAASPDEDSTVELSNGAERLRSGAPGTLAAGAALAAGDSVRTQASGSATVKLPDASRVRVSGGSELRLARSARDEVTLELSRGRVTAQAAHVPRKAFVVRAGGVSVQVVGTVFSVATGERDVEVAVAEGRVRVALPNGQERFVGAGERLVVEHAGSQTRGLALSARDRAEFKQLGSEVPPSAPAERPRPQTVSSASPPPAPAGASVPPPTSVASAAVQADAPPAPQAATGGAVEPVSGQGFAQPSPPPLVKDEDEDEAEDEERQEELYARPGPANPFPPISVPSVVPAFPLPVFGGPPAQPAPAPGPTAAPSAPARSEERLPENVESLFLRRAEAGLREGPCAPFLPGLADVLEHSEEPANRGKARVLRARCFASQLRREESLREYRRYLTESPGGPYAAEARQALSR